MGEQATPRLSPRAHLEYRPRPVLDAKKYSRPGREPDLIEVLERWDTIENPQAYARRAAINYAIKNRQRGLLRITGRLVERGDVRLEGDLDPGLLVWEQQEWVTLLLKSLPLAERQVLACVMDAFRPEEIARLLGKTEAAVRQNLHAARKRLARRLGGTEHYDTPEEVR